MTVLQAVAVTLGGREFQLLITVHWCDEGGCGAAVPADHREADGWLRAGGTTWCPKHSRRVRTVRDDWSDVQAIAAPPANTKP